MDRCRLQARLNQNRVRYGKQISPQMDPGHGISPSGDKALSGIGIGIGIGLLFCLGLMNKTARKKLFQTNRFAEKNHQKLDRNLQHIFYDFCQNHFFLKSSKRRLQAPIPSSPNLCGNWIWQHQKKKKKRNNSKMFQFLFWLRPFWERAINLWFVNFCIWKARIVFPLHFIVEKRGTKTASNSNSTNPIICRFFWPKWKI